MWGARGEPMGLTQTKLAEGWRATQTGTSPRLQEGIVPGNPHTALLVTSTHTVLGSHAPGSVPGASRGGSSSGRHGYWWCVTVRPG